MRIGLVTILLLLGMYPASAQKQLVSTVDFEEALVYYRPRIVLSTSGEYAVSWEALRKLDDFEEWQVAVQRFSAAGAPVQEVQYLTKSTQCDRNVERDEQDLFEIGLRNIDMAFASDGLLMVSMEQYEQYQESPTATTRFVSGARLSLMDREGQEFQPDEASGCDWQLFDPVTVQLSGKSKIDVDLDAKRLLGPDGRPLQVMPTMNASLESITDEQNASPHAALIPDYTASWVNVAAHGWVNMTHKQQCQDNLKAAPCDASPHVFAQLSTMLETGNQESDASVDGQNRQLGFSPAEALGISGHRVRVWIDYQESELGRVIGQLYDDSGSPMGEPFKVSLGGREIDNEAGSRPEVAMLDDGRFLVVWTQYQKGMMRAMGRHFEAAGMAADKPFSLDPDTTRKTGFPDVTAIGSQFAYTWVAYHENVTSIFVNVPGVTNFVDQAFANHNTALSLKGYPNPFTHETRLEYSLPESGHVTLVIFDLLGREVKRLIDQQQGPGSYSISLQANELDSGYYFTRLRQGDQLESQILVRAE